MNRARLLIGVLLAGTIGPAMGIAGNSDHSWGKTIAAVCFALVGCAFIVREALNAKNHRRV
jgi:hypothetical protein